MPGILIADSGSTKTDWCFLQKGQRKKYFSSQGLSPYFLGNDQINEILLKEISPKLKTSPGEVYFYGTGLGNPENVKNMSKVFSKSFPGAKVSLDTDITGAARALCGTEKGIACILGTGSNSCYYNGRKITKHSPGLGYVLGDEGSGAYLGKKVVQYYIYKTFEPDLMDRFQAKYMVTVPEILDRVYKQPLPNRYLAGFTEFLAENRGHYMVENIIEDGFNDFFFNHIYKFTESWRFPVNFTGSVAFGFRDMLQDMCNSYELQLGKVLKTPMEGLIKYHQPS